MPRANDLSPLIHAQHARAGARAEQLRTTPWGAASRPRRALWQRVLAGAVALSLWLSPLSLTIEQARNAAGVLGAGAFSWTRLDDRQAVQAMLPRLQLGFGIPSAQAAPIADPNAPITFRPTITQSTGANGGVPVVNIAAPNANGISLNQYQQFNIDPIGLILNNSMLSGTSLTGGQVAANPNLTSRAASLIVNQVTSTGSAFASALNGPLEVFGTPATVVIANPNGISTLGTAFTNTPSVILTTGVPQMLTQVGGSATSFDNATAVGYNVTGGHIQIEGNAGANGPGAGIDGTVGNIDLIAETIGIGAPLYAGTKINAIAGDQMVTPASIDSTGGTAYSTSSNGSANTAAAITAATNGAQSYAIDATAYGAVTAGEIQLVGTPAGLGVQLDAQMTANTGNLQISSNGDLTLAGSAAQTQATLQSAGNIALTGSHIGVGGYTINANGDLTSTGTLQSGQDLSITAGGNVNLASAQANGNITINAGNNLTTGILQAGEILNATAQNSIQLNGLTQSGSDMSLNAVTGTLTSTANVNSDGNMTANTGQGMVLGAQTSATNNVTLNAGQDSQVNGTLASGLALGIATQGNLLVNGTMASGAATTLTVGQDIDVKGTVAATAALSANAQGNIVLASSSNTGATGALSLNAEGNVTSSGTLSSVADMSVTAGQGIVLSGQTTVGGNTALTSGQDTDIEGSLIGKGGATLVAGGDFNLTGGAVFSQDVDLTSAGSTVVSGILATNGALSVTAQNAITLASGSVTGATGNLTLTSTGAAVTSNGTLIGTSGLTIGAAQDITLNGTTTSVGAATLTSSQAIVLNGTLAGQSSANLTADGDIDLAGSAGFTGDTTLNAGGNVNLGGSLQGNAVQITAGDSATLNNLNANATLSVQTNGTGSNSGLTVNGAVASVSDATLQSANAINVGNAATLQVGGALTATATGDTLLSGFTTSVGSMTLTNTNGSLTSTGELGSGGALNASAGQDVTLAGILIGNTTISATAQGNLTLSGALQSGSDMTLAAVNGNITTSGNAAVGGNLSANAGQAINLGGTTVVSGNSTLTAGQALSFTDSLVTVGNGTFSAGTDINGAGTLGVGEIAQLNAGGNIALTGTLTAGTLNAVAGNNAAFANLQTSGTLAIQADGNAGEGDVSLSGTVNSTDALTLQAARDVNVMGTVAGGTTVGVTAARDINVSGTLQSASDMTLNATGAIDANGSLTSGTSVTATAGQEITLNNVQTATTLIANANGGDLDVTGIATALGAASLSASGDTTISGVLGGSTVNVISEDNLNVTGGIQSVGDMTLSAVNGSLTTAASGTTGGDLISGGNLIASAGQNLTLGALTTVALNTTLSAGQTLTQNGTLAGYGTGQLTAGGDIAGSGSSVFSLASTMSAGADIDLTGSFQAGTLSAGAVGNLTLTNAVTTGIPDANGNPQVNGTFIANAGLSLTLAGQSLANGTATLTSGQDMTLGGLFNTATAATLTAGQDLLVNGQVESASTLNAQATGNITIAAAGALGSLSDMTVNAQTGSLTVNGGLNSGGALSATSGQATIFAQGSTVSAVNALNVTAGSAMTLDGTLVGQASGTLTSGGDMTGAGTQAITQNAMLNAGGNLSLTGSLQANQVQATGTGGAALNNVNTATTLALTANGGDATLNGTVVAPGTVAVQGSQDAIVNGAVTSGSTVALTGGVNATINGSVQAVGDVTLGATQGTAAINTGGSVVTDGNLGLSGQNVTLNGSATVNGSTASDGTVTSPGNTSLTAIQSMTIGGTISGQGSGTLSAGTDIDGAGVMAFGQAAQVTAGGNVALTAGLQGSTVQVTAANNAGVGTVQATTGDIDIAAQGQAGQGDVTAGGALIATGAVALNAARDITVAGGIEAGSTATLTAQRNITLGADLDSVGDAVLTATTGQISGTDLISQGNLTATAATAVNLTGLALAGTNATLTAGTTIQLTGGVVANDLVGLTAGGALSAGTVGAGTNATLQTGAGLTVTGAVQANGTLTATSNGSMSLGAAASGSDMNLQANGSASNLTIDGALISGGVTNLQAAQDITVSGALSGATTVTLNAGRNLTLGSTLSADDDVQLTATTGALSSAGTISTQGNLTTQSGGATSLNGALVNGNTTVNAGGAAALSGSLLGLGTLNVTAGGAITGGGALTYDNNIQLGAGEGITLGAIEGGGTFNVTAPGTISLGAVTALGNVDATSTSGSVAIAGAATSGGNLAITAAGGVSATGGLSSMGTVNVTGSTGNVTLGGLSSNGNSTVNAGQTLTLSGTSAVAGELALSGANVSLAGSISGSENINVTAQGTLDASQATLTSTQNTQLSGANVTLGNVIAGGTLAAQASNQLSLSGSYVDAVGNVTLTSQNGLTNASSVLAGGALNVSAVNLTNTASGSLASTANTTITATNFDNAGVVNGENTTINVGNSLTNVGGALLAVNALNIDTGTLNNQNGLIFAGNLSSSSASSVGDVSLTVTGGTGALNNANGQVLAQNDAALNLANMGLDASSQGTIGAGNNLSITVQSMSLGGNWTINAGNISIDALQGFSNAGQLNASGALSISSGGSISNTGQIVSAGNLSLSGSIDNAAGAILNGENLTLSGSVTNRGTIESVGGITFNGPGNYDNQYGTTQANGTIQLNTGGTIYNTAGTIAAAGDVDINAGAIVNNGTQGATQTQTIQVAATADTALYDSIVVGTMTVWLWQPAGQGTYTPYSETQTATLASLYLDLNNGVLDVQTNAPTQFDCEDQSCETQPADQIGSGLTATEYGESTGLETITLPEIDRTIVSQGPGTAGVIMAGNNVNITANSLSNEAGVISAGNNVNLNLQSLSNGTLGNQTAQVTDTVDQAQLNAFMAKLDALDGAGLADMPQAWCQCDGSAQETTVTFNSSAAVPASITTTTTTFGQQGLIMAGQNMTVTGGSLVNAGTLYAGNNFNASATQSFTNQGQYISSTSTQPGCTPDVSSDECAYGNSLTGPDANSSSFSYAQQNATIYAGNDLVIAAGQIDNTYGTLIAGHDIVIGGVGTTATSTTPASSLTNTSGNIVAGNDITLNVSGALTNTLPAPTLVHEFYGAQEEYAGCMTANGGYSGYCEAYVEQQSGNSSTISAGNGLTINAGSLSNVDSLISAGQSATINVSGPIVNTAQTLNAYWHSYWVQETSWFNPNVQHNVWACGTAAECTAIYGSAYTNTGGVIDPPTPVSSIAATIEAPNLNVVSGSQIQNTGNILGSQVVLTGASLVNGITTANIYTPPSGGVSQSISLAPNHGLVSTLGLSSGNTTSSNSSSSGDVSYVLNTSGSSTSNIGPSTLLSELPADLQPSSELFYYSPQAQDLVLQQAALTQTGEDSFVNCTVCGSQTLSAADQDTEQMYSNAATFATANNIQLGTALTQAQIATLTQPILWYVQETIPDPSCTSTLASACPTVSALMPEVYLPPGYTAETAEGNISGTNVTLNVNGGTVLNTGNISASNTLTVNAASLTNQQNTVNVGQIWNYVQAGNGAYIDTFGTMAQSGGTMSAANMNLNVQALNQIGGTLQQLSTDGSVDTAATQQLLSTLQTQLGTAFQQSTVTSNLQTSTVAQGGNGLTPDELSVMVMAVMAAIAMQPEISAEIASAAGATAGTVFAAGTTAGSMVGAGLGNIALTAGLDAMATSTLSQAMLNGSVNFSSVLDTGLVSAITAGLLNGITYTSAGGFGVTAVASPNSIASLSAAPAFGSAVVPQAAITAGTSLPTELTAFATNAIISAGVQTAIEGGSFLNNLKTDGITEASADIANAIGQMATANGSLIPINSPQYILAHAVLGCATSAALGTGCEGGAIGAAASALISPNLVNQLDPLGVPLNSEQTAAVTALATLAGGLTAGLAGANVQAGAQAAQNEARNNSTLDPPQRNWVQQNASAFAAFYYQTTGLQISTQQAQQILLANAYIVNDATAAEGPGYDSTAGMYINKFGGAMFSSTPAQWANPGQLATTSGPATPEQAALPGGTANPVAGVIVVGGSIAIILAPELGVGLAGDPLFSSTGLFGSTSLASPVGVGLTAATVNATSQGIQSYIKNGSVSINPVQVVTSGLAGAIGAIPIQSPWTALLINAAANGVAAGTATLANNIIANSNNPWSSVLSSSVTGAVLGGIGYGAGYAVSAGASSIIKPTINSYNWAGTGQWSSSGYNIFSANNLPAVSASVGGSVTQEISSYISDKINGIFGAKQ
jgi:filamentous hemagglutinin